MARPRSLNPMCETALDIRRLRDVGGDEMRPAAVVGDRSGRRRPRVRVLLEERKVEHPAEGVGREGRRGQAADHRGAHRVERGAGHRIGAGHREEQLALGAPEPGHRGLA